MNNTVRVNYRISSSIAEYIKDVAKENKISQTAALEKIVSEHSTFVTNEKSNQIVAEYLADCVVAKLNKTLTRIRLASNNADRNSDVIIELLNGIYNFEEYLGLVSTDDNLHSGVQKAQEVVQNRIETYRLKRLEQAKKKQQDGDE